MSRDNSRQRNAVRRAREARAKRDQARQVREDQIEAALATLFAALAEVERRRTTARRKADAALADGERAIAEPYTAACTAVRTLHDLLGSNTAVAELCELRAEDVRDMLAAARAQRPASGGRAMPEVSSGGESSAGSADTGQDARAQSAARVSDYLTDHDS